MLSSEIQGAGSLSRRELPLRQQQCGENRCTVGDSAGPKARGVWALARGSDCAGNTLVSLGWWQQWLGACVYMVAHGTSAGQRVVLGAGEDGNSPTDAYSQHPRAGGGGDTRAELADPAATSLGDSAVEGWCFGVLAGDLGAIHRTHWQRWETWA